jgi:hypothetical protein
VKVDGCHWEGQPLQKKTKSPRSVTVLMGPRYPRTKALGPTTGDPATLAAP